MDEWLEMMVFVVMVVAIVVLVAENGIVEPVSMAAVDLKPKDHWQMYVMAAVVVVVTVVMV